jgi:hypothetical protein
MDGIQYSNYTERKRSMVRITQSYNPLVVYFSYESHFMYQARHTVNTDGDTNQSPPLPTSK